MKKIIFFIITCALGIAISQVSNAKTSGHYASLDFLQTKSHNLTTNRAYRNQSTGDLAFKDQALGYGVSYRYGQSLDLFSDNDFVKKFFIAPGAFYEKNNIRAHDDPNGSDMIISRRYGAKVDLGLDVTDRFSVYLPVGVARVGYTSIVRRGVDSDYSTSTKYGHEISPFYGVGLSFEAFKNVTSTIEYTVQKFSPSTAQETSEEAMQRGGNNANYGLRSTLKILKFGIAYKF